MMYTVSVESSFSAIHRVRMANGAVEDPHGHDWKVRAVFARSHLDDSGMVVDFEAAREALEALVARLHHSDLDEHEFFAGLHPTAEVVAVKLFEKLAAAGLETLFRIEVTEAPGCVAAFERER